MTEIRSDAREFERAARALASAAEGRYAVKGLNAALRNAARPIGREVVREGAAEMPHRGGLSAIAARSRVNVTSRVQGDRAMVSLRFSSKKAGLGYLDTGYVRHLVFGRKKSWVTQPVPARAFTRAFERHASEARNEVLKEMHALTETIKGMS